MTEQERKDRSSQPGPHSPGQILKEVRESKGISLETVQNATKIPLDALKGIEEGYTLRTLSPFYIKGFIKMYAQYLGVDVSDVLEEDRIRSLAPSPQPIRRVVAGEPKLPAVLARRYQQAIVKVAGIVVLLLIFGKIAGCIRHKARTPREKAPVTSTSKKTAAAKTVSKKAPKRKPTPKPPVRPPAKKPAKPKAAPVSNAAVRQAATASKPVPSRNIRLTIKTLKSGWLQVKVDGNLVFQSTIRDGVVETWEANDKIEISGKNIHNLQFELNGKVLGTLGRADRSARRVVITKDGLNVIQ